MSNRLHFSAQSLSALTEKLNKHPLYGSIQTLDDLRVLMNHHIFSVWDFMSLLKYLQHHIAPAAYPWRPQTGASTRYFINQIVLGEESDEGLPDEQGNSTYVSHFELYCQAMREVGADPEPAVSFSDVAAQVGIASAFELNIAPPAAREFMEATFGFIDTNKPHVVAAAFALGREHIIPEMFRAFLAKMNIGEEVAPAFHYYLIRHVHLDEESHAPLSLAMVNELIDNDPKKLDEAQQAAMMAVQARIKFWDGVLEAVQANRRASVS